MTYCIDDSIIFNTFGCEILKKAKQLFVIKIYPNFRHHIYLHTDLRELNMFFFKKR